MSFESAPLNVLVREYWEQEPCGTHDFVVGERQPRSPAWFAEVEDYRYRAEPFIHSIAQFTRHRGKAVLEVGVGAGTDHLQWARAGTDLSGVDLTDAAIETTRAHLQLHGLSSCLQRIDAERLPFPDASFDVVYSWGVIHHSNAPHLIIVEIERVLKPGGVFIGMMYQRGSLVTLRVWLRHALLRGRPWRSFRDVLFHHVESLGTKAYTPTELRRLFGPFSSVAITPLLTPYDTQGLPRWLSKFVPQEWGWFLAIRAFKAAAPDGEAA